MGFIVVDGKQVPVDDAVIDYLMSPPSDEETAAPSTALAPQLNCLGPSPHHQVIGTCYGRGGPPAEAPQTASRLFPGPPLHDGVNTIGASRISLPKLEPSQLPVEVACRWKRVIQPKARAVVTAQVQAEQFRKRLMVTPPCTWCGLPTGCFCDQCRRQLCTPCDKALGQCVQCCCSNMKCTEGQARQHAALVLKQLPEDDFTRQNVDPFFAALPFEEQAKIFVESGAPVDPNGKLQRRERQVAEASRPRQLSAEEVAMLEETKKQQHVHAAAVQKEEQRVALLHAEEEARRIEHIAYQNAVARSNRSNRRHGAGCAGLVTTMEPISGYVQDRTNPAGSDEEPEPSKAQRRRERQRAGRAAAAQRKAAQAEQRVQEEFLRETAPGFTERQLPLEPTEPKKAKEPKAKAPKETVQNDLAEDLLVGLWNAKLTTKKGNGLIDELKSNHNHHNKGKDCWW